MCPCMTGADGKSLIGAVDAGRKNPGLSAQHLTGLQLVSDITKGKLDGGAIRSTSIRYAWHVQAGSCVLLPAGCFVS